MSNQKVKQPVTAEIIERLDSVLNEMNALYASEKDYGYSYGCNEETGTGSEKLSDKEHDAVCTL